MGVDGDSSWEGVVWRTVTRVPTGKEIEVFGVVVDKC